MRYFFRKLYRDLLIEEGYRVDVCENGSQTIQFLEQHGADLVLTDMVMPGSNGLEVLRFARSLTNPPDVILVTGHGSLESAIDALKNGAHDYLLKPFNPEELKHIVRGCLDQRRLLTENDHLRRQIQLFQCGQSLSSLIELDLLIPQALDVLLRETHSSVGCAFTLKGGATPCVVSVKNMATGYAGVLVDILLPEIELKRGFYQPGIRVEKKLIKMKQQLDRIWMLPLYDGDVLKGGILLLMSLVLTCPLRS